MKQFNSLAELYQYAVTTYPQNQANKLINGSGGYTYAEFDKKCRELSELLSSFGLGADSKIAIYSGSTPNWGLAFFSATAFGRISVPLLPDFSENEVTNVLTHSETQALFVSERLLAKVSPECRQRLKIIIDIMTLKPIYLDGKALTPEEQDIKGSENAPVKVPGPEDLAALIYTSGTTGKAKGVMLAHRCFTNNVLGAYDFFPIQDSDVFLSILPLAHTYELSIGLIYPFSGGACVAYMTKKPTPSALKEALPLVRPTVMLTVPLIIEKVYKGVVLPKVKKSRTLSWMNKHMNRTFSRMAGKEILRYFGGRLRFFGIGGAPLDITVENFLHKAKFPYYIGYGLTETAPLLAGCAYNNTIPGGIGHSFTNMQLRLLDVNPNTGEGEIIAKGPSVMLGYYKDPERTKAAFTEDGWFRTNDLATLDEKGRFRIKGRLNNMILGSSGENIYPEEIEKVIKDQEGIAEAIVIQRNKTLIALIELSDGVVNDLKNFKNKILNIVNSKVSSSSKISEVQIMKEPFIKTATQKIRRFLYKDTAPTLEDKNHDEAALKAADKKASEDESRKD